MSLPKPPRLTLETLRFVYLRRIVGTVLGALGLERSLRLATALARGYVDLNPPGRTIAAERLIRAFGDALPSPQCDAIVAAMYEHIARFWIEALFLPRRLRAGSWRRFVALPDEALLRDIAARGRGCVLATAYFGNIAVAAFALGEIFRPVHVIVDYLADPAARAWQEQLYRVGNVRPLAVEDTTRRLPEILGRGGAVLLVVEHRRRRGGGVPASFLGESGTYQPTPGRLAEWFGAPLLPVLCRRRPGDFSFELWTGRPCSSGAAAERTGEALSQLDTRIRRWPEQYLWNVPVPQG